MKKLIFILFLFCSLQGYAQIDSVKHIEIVSEIQDTMALLNKRDIDKINRVFFERDKLDSLYRANEEIISLYQTKCLYLLNASALKDDIIKDKDFLISETKVTLEAKYERQKLETKKMKTKKII